MTRIWTRTGLATTVAVLTAACVLMVGGVAHADLLKDNITGSGSVALIAGSPTSGTASIRVQATGGDGDVGCNIDDGESPLSLNVITPAGVTATPNPVLITNCDDEFPVAFIAGVNAVSGVVTVEVGSTPGGTYNNDVSIPITVTQPALTNTAPTVEVDGVIDGAAYEFGTVLAPTCVTTDAEDGASTADAVVTGTLVNGLGSQTATCDYTDGGGLAAETASATYSIVDTIDPTISYTLDPAAANDAGWFNTDVVVDFTCADDGSSGIADCTGDTTLTEGANQSATGTATDFGGNTASSTVSGINIDTTAPVTPTFVGGPTGSYYFGSDPAAPTCDSSDALSGLASCVVTGGGSSVGAHSFAATATDVAGNISTATLNYEVLAWNLNGFYSPVDMGGVWNTVKGGSTVPLKFEIFAGTELTSVSAIRSFTTAQVACPGSSAATDAIELTTTGGTVLRYDSTGGQFVQNWATPKKPGACIKVTMTAQDGSSIVANFLLK